jgi:predicted MFS family arabinose efflux permease
MIALRLVTNTGSRMMFTFLPEFSRGTGIGVDQLGRLLSLRDLSGLTAPYFGRASDRVGTRKVMIISGALATIGMLLFSLGALGVIIGLACFGLGRIGYNVGMNAWVGNEVAYERRGRASGQVEMTWAGAALVGLPTMGLLIDRLGWRAAPLALTIVTLPLTVMLADRLPKPMVADRGAGRRPTMSRTAWATLGAFTLLNGAAQLLVFSHGIWLEQTYGFNPSQVGFAIVVVGLAELISSFTSSRLTDRLGKRNSVAVGALVLTIGLTGLAVFDQPPLAMGLALLVVAFLGFEFGIVSAVPLVAELDPMARAEMIGRSVGMSIVARAAGSLVASVLILSQGFRFTMTLAALLAATTTTVTAAVVKEPVPTDRSR